MQLSVGTVPLATYHNHSHPESTGIFPELVSPGQQVAHKSKWSSPGTYLECALIFAFALCQVSPNTFSFSFTYTTHSNICCTSIDNNNNKSSCLMGTPMS